MNQESSLPQTTAESEKILLSQLVDNNAALGIIDAYFSSESSFLAASEEGLGKLTDEELIEDFHRTEARMDCYRDVLENAVTVKDYQERRLAIAISLLAQRSTLLQHSQEGRFPGRTYDALSKMSQIGTLLRTINIPNVRISIYRKATELSSDNRRGLIELANQGEFTYIDADIITRVVRASEHTIALNEITRIEPAVLRIMGRIAHSQYADGTREVVLQKAIKQAQHGTHIITKVEEAAQLLTQAYEELRHDRAESDEETQKVPVGEERQQCKAKLIQFIDEWAQACEVKDFNRAAAAFTDAVTYWRAENNKHVLPHISMDEIQPKDSRRISPITRALIEQLPKDKQPPWAAHP